MNTRLEIKQWGNSKAIRLPKDFIHTLNLDTGDFLELNQVDNKFILTVIPKNSPKKRLTLDERLQNENYQILNDWDNFPIASEELI
ncbi:AbrB/MazE/SpoVT family DNA-binding domain-containing protein [Aggregatibacter actinomycetemcomitans]|uniref:AbrB/MazE/SpoVT family DNA-binding domain-containing protein n=1 Tax=Aggregatibacter actinomycetemcomitans TaxID=714 RepID=UPI00197C2746|nr:AbrB/MazE/SpoVT family DNA-binding domain-containing protein [Aggregatibacter actinomycetemcomitans]MBN6067890.1 AbrB/MazE/SpoVT family DNA-binding domain-containing protein [Aggregatibacter actinomycetemcomitans]MBN6085827.1 AbrB/MazE/SpoVT family DNA-binding domain-containing protein [Aggregatibacter actinomycetemcomitans]